MSNAESAPREPGSRAGLCLLVEREFVHAKTKAYGPNKADDDTPEGDFGTWGDWRALVLRVAAAAVEEELERLAAEDANGREGDILRPGFAARLVRGS